MIVRTLKASTASPRRVAGKGWESVRLLLKDDNAGFSFHITTIYQGERLEMHYKNHCEAVYCIQGTGEIVLPDIDNKVYPIAPGTLYVLDQHDKHILCAETEMIMACVFNPALYGNEVHDADGSYPSTAKSIID